LKRLIVNTLLLFTALAASHAARPYKVYDGDTFLSSGNVYNLFYDSEEMVWVSTENGLNRYDGNRFNVYFHDPSDSTSIASNFVTCVAEDREEHLYVCSHAGIQLYDRGRDAFCPPAKDESGKRYHEQVLGLTVLRDGRVVVVGSKVMLAEIRKDGLHVRRPDFPVPEGYVDEVLQDIDGSLWFVTERGGLAKSRPDGSFARYLSGSGHNISDIFLDMKGDVYVGDLTGGLWLYDRDADDFELMRWEGGTMLSVNKICQSTYNDLFVCTGGDWVKVFHTDTRTFSNSSTSLVRSLSDASASAIIRDRYGNVWVATDRKGLVVMPAYVSDFGYIGPDSVNGDVIGSGNVTALEMDKDGILWVGSQSEGIFGISEDNKQMAHFRRYGGDLSKMSAVTVMHEDSRGRLWIGTMDSGAGIFDRRSGATEFVSLGDGEDDTRNVSDFSEDADGNLWISTIGGGIFRYDMETGEAMNLSDLGADVPLHVTTIHVASDGKIWFGSFRGACCIDPSKDLRQGWVTEGGIVHVIREGHDGKIWIGYDDGLYGWDPLNGKGTAYGVAEGLPGNVVYSIEEDGSGTLWLGTNRGLSHFDPSSGLFVNYVSEDGIQGNEFCRNASCKDAEGKMIFGGQSGLTEFDPKLILDPSRRWNVRVTAVLVHDRPVTVGRKSGRREMVDVPIWKAKDVWLGHRDNSFTVLFAPLNFAPPERLRLCYRMGDGEWQEASDAMASFSSLHAGRYVLSLMAKDNGVMSDVTQVTFHVRPPWWASWWGLLLFAMAICIVAQVIIALYRKNRLAKARIDEMSQEDQASKARLQMASALSHELRSPLSLIISPLRRLMTSDEDSERQKKYRVMLHNAERIVSLSNQLLDIRKMAAGDIRFEGSEEELEEGAEEARLEELGAGTAAPEVEVSHSKSKYWVYVVDGDEDVRNYLVGELSPYYHVGAYPGGKEALSAVFEKRPDAMVCDLRAPELDGLSLCRRIKENINLNDIQFLILSASKDEKDNIAALAAGADAYIGKPFDIGVLKQSIDSHLRSRTVLRNKYAGSQLREDKLPALTLETPDDQLMARVQRVLNENISNPDFTVEKLSEEVGISRVHIYRKLKELTNQSASDFIRNSRLAAAAKLLSEGRQSIGDVARAAGFSSPDYFTTAFKKNYGKTPREYMEQCAEDSAGCGDVGEK